MQDVAAWVLVALTGGLGLLAVFLVQPVRAGACLAGAVFTASGLAFLEGAGDLSVALLTSVAAGAALLILVTALLLNLTSDETAGRRLRFQPTLHLLVLVWLGWVIWQEGGTPQAGRAPPLPAGATATAVFEVQGLPLALAGLVLLTTLLASLIVARRHG